MHVLLSTALIQEAVEGNLVVLLHMDLRITEERGYLSSQAGNVNPDLGNGGYAQPPGI